MPKPLSGDNANGMHCHQSLWRDDQNQFYDAQGWALTSDLCRRHIGGRLPSANAYLAFAAMLMVGLDGIENRIAPGAPLDRNITRAKSIR